MTMKKYILPVILLVVGAAFVAAASFAAKQGNCCQSAQNCCEAKASCCEAVAVAKDCCQPAQRCCEAEGDCCAPAAVK